MSVRRAAVAVALAGALLLAGAGLAACGSDEPAAPPIELSEAGTRGEQVAMEQGCTSCHSVDGKKGTGPTWQDLAGAEVKLEGGTTVVADETYLRESILYPREKVVDGFVPQAMPIYDGELSEAEVADLLAYLDDLSSISLSGAS